MPALTFSFFKTWDCSKARSPTLNCMPQRSATFGRPKKQRFLNPSGSLSSCSRAGFRSGKLPPSAPSFRDARIEFFVHGALCVSYSGQCWMSQALTGRSANRGECSQLCRLPYDVYTEAGTELAKSKHVLSLKDNDQSANLEALIDAGVSSFKIEGRLKGAAYVKNVTAFYRRKLDEIIARRPELSLVHVLRSVT